MAKRRLEVSEGSRRLTLGQLRTLTDVFSDLDETGRSLVQLILAKPSRARSSLSEGLPELQKIRERILSSEPQNPKTTDNELLAEVLDEVRSIKSQNQDQRPAVTIGKLKEDWEKAKASKRTLHDDTQKLRHLIKWLKSEETPIDSISTDQMIRYLDEVAVGKKPASVNRFIALLKGIFNYATKRGYKHSNPMVSISLLPERNERTRVASEEEYELLTSKATGGMKLAIVLAYETGMRRTEICTVKMNTHFRSEPAPHFILGEDETKADQSRMVPLNKVCMKALKDCPGGVGIHPDSVSDNFASLCSELGIRDLRFHDLRGSFATKMLREGVDSMLVAKFTGHKDITVLQKRYARLQGTDMLDVVKQRDKKLEKKGKKAV